jgi:hypothetical protein
MSESLAEPITGDVVWSLDDVPTGQHLPRRVARARREAADASAVAAADWAPSWSVAPAPAYGAAVPLDDEIT